MNDNRKYIVIPASAAPNQVYPINDSQVDFTQSKASDDQVFYERKLKNKIVFGNDSKNSIADFTYFYGYEQNITTRCTTFTLNIFKKCDGVWILDWVGEFSLNDADWDLDRCTVSVKVEPSTIYNCVKKHKNDEFNILTLPNIISTSTNLSFNYEYFSCHGLTFLPTCTLPGVQTGTWTLAFQELNHPLTYKCTTYGSYIKVYYREFVITACVGGQPQPPPGTGWALESNDCATTQTAKYVRVPVSGPYPSSQFGFGWWNYITNTQELPPEAVFKSIVVTNTPASQTSFFLGQNKLVYAFGGAPQPTIDFYFEVLNNANSTYVWSLDAGSPLTATVTGTGNVCKVTPTQNAAGNVWVLLTETHGNAYVSTQIFIIPQVVASAGFSQTITQDITGPTIVCPNQQTLFFRCTPAATCTLGNPTILWAVTGSASITAGQGTDQINVTAPASGSFTVSVTWQIFVTGSPGYSIICTSSQVVTVKEVPATPPLIVVDEAYPNEPLTIFTYTHVGSTWKAYRDTTTLSNPSTFGPLAFLATNAPAVTGTYCYLFKETINCVCNYVKIVSESVDSTVEKLPALYWCPNNSSAINYTRNRSFKEVVEAIVDNMGCGINGVVSDFFDWNAIGDAPGYSPGNNYVLVNLGFSPTTNWLTDITIAQKSDIINYLSSNPATIGKLTFDKLEKIFAYMFHAYWFIDSLGNLRIEHWSYFQRTLAYNANALPHKPFNVAKNKYTYDKTKMPKFEKFACSEMMFTDFIGTAIYYDNLCVDQDPSTNTKERTLDFITTDLYALFLDPANAVKTGFVLMANSVIGSTYNVAIEQGVLSTAQIVNGHLSWANLHNNYHRHGRVLIQGYMNNVLTTFVSAKPIKSQKDIVLKICCGDTFDPLIQKYKTELSDDGVVDEAEEQTSKGIIKMTLLH